MTQKYNLGDMSQKWIFFAGQKSAKKADFGVFGTFLPFFQKNVKFFLFSIFYKTYVLGLFWAKNTVKNIKMTKKYFLLKIFEKYFFDIFWKKSAKKADFGVFGTFLHFFLKNFQNFNFFQKLCFRAILCQKHVQKGQNNKKIFFCWKFLKNDFLYIFAKKVPKRPILAFLAFFALFWTFFEKFSKFQFFSKVMF